MNIIWIIIIVVVAVIFIIPLLNSLLDLITTIITAKICKIQLQLRIEENEVNKLTEIEIPKQTTYAIGFQADDIKEVEDDK